MLGVTGLAHNGHRRFAVQISVHASSGYPARPQLQRPDQRSSCDLMQVCRSCLRVLGFETRWRCVFDIRKNLEPQATQGCNSLDILCRHDCSCWSLNLKLIQETINLLRAALNFYFDTRIHIPYKSFETQFLSNTINSRTKSKALHCPFKDYAKTSVLGVSVVAHISQPPWTQGSGLRSR